MGMCGINAMRLVLLCTVLLAETQGFSSFQAPWTSPVPPLPGHGSTRASVTQRCTRPYVVARPFRHAPLAGGRTNVETVGNAWMHIRC